MAEIVCLSLWSNIVENGCLADEVKDELVIVAAWVLNELLDVLEANAVNPRGKRVDIEVLHVQLVFLLRKAE